MITYLTCLPSSFGPAAAAGLSSPVEGRISRDRIARKLSGKRKTPADPRRAVKPPIRQSESPEGVPIADAQHIGKTSDRWE